MVGALGGIYAIWMRELKRAIRDRGQLIGGLSRPIVWVLILGIGLNPYFRSEIYGNVYFVVPYTYVQFLLPAVIVLNIMFTGVQSAISLIWDREYGFLREVLVSPTPRSNVLIGKVLGGATVAFAHGCIVLVIAQLASVPLQVAHILIGLGLMFGFAFAMTCVGVVIANRMRSFEGFGVFANAVILPVYFASSSIFPLNPALTGTETRFAYPDWLVLIVTYNPVTYAVDALRGVFIGFNQFNAALGPIVIAVLAAVSFAIALWDFSRRT